MPRMQAGAAIYQDNCEACHSADGKGESVIFPPLAGNPIIRQASAETLVRVVLAGTQSANTHRRAHRGRHAVFRLAAERPGKSPMC